MTIAKIIDYLESSISSIKETEKKSCRKDKDVQWYAKLLSHLQKLLIESADGKNLPKLKEALIFLEMIPIQQFLSGKNLLFKLLVKDDYPTFLGIRQFDNKRYSSSAPVKNTYQKLLKSLHVALAKQIFPNKPQWSFSYPLEENSHQIMNDAIRVYQEGSVLLSSPQNAFKDFARDTEIIIETMPKRDELNADPTLQIASAVSDFVDSATAYDEEENALLKVWLSANGGQDNNRFIDFLIDQKHFTDEECKLASSQALEQQWFVNEGKIYLSCDVLIKSLLLFRQNLPTTIMYVDPSNLNTGKDPVTETTEFDQLAENPKHKLKALLRIKGLIELNIAEKVNEAGVKQKYVNLKMVALDAISYTNHLRSPARFLSPIKEVERKSGYKMS